MMKQLFFLTLLLAAGPASAANVYVMQGDDLQQKINFATNGDTLVIQAGSYTNDVTFNKPVTVLRTGTNDVIRLLGNVQVRSTGEINFAQCRFSSALSIQCTGTVSFSQCVFIGAVTSQSANVLLSQIASSNTFIADLTSTSGTNLQSYDSVFYNPSGYGLTAVGGKVLIKRCEIWGLSLSTNAGFEALRLTNFYANLPANGYPGITATASSNPTASFVCVQSSLVDCRVTLTGFKVWVGYTTSYRNGYNHHLILNDCDSVLIGNRFTGFGPAGSQSVVSVIRGTLKAYNNLISVSTADSGFGGFYLYSIFGELINNTVILNTLSGGHNPIYIDGTGGPITIRGTITKGVNVYPVYSTGPSLLVSYCDFASTFYRAYPESTPVVECISVDPLFNGDYSLATNSPCIGKGPPEAIYNNRGTTNRNDMGYTGGPYYNPASYTNNNPMVFFLTGSPQTVFKGPGGRTNIQVNAAASAGH